MALTILKVSDDNIAKEVASQGDAYWNGQTAASLSWGDSVKEALYDNVYLNDDSATPYVASDFLTDCKGNAAKAATFEAVLKEIQYENFLAKKNNSNAAQMDEEISKAKDGKLSGEVVFKLYDTYGFPFELTQEIAEESGISVSRDEFDAEMNKQKERARNARNVKDSFASQNEELMNFNEPSEFIGYDHLSCDGKIIALFNAEGKMVDSLEDEGMIILDETCFYAESGGQVADKGVFTADGVEVEVLDVQKTRNKQHIHTVKINSGVLEKGMSLYGEVNVKDRLATTANHSCTHLLQSALVKVLGDHIHQAGSYNCPEYLRFDFNHYEKVTAEQLAEVERIVNEYISAAYPVTKEVMPIEEAKRSGATALFDEKYGDTVRVVTMGDVSKEFCAGCHVENTAQIGLCKIISEEVLVRILVVLRLRLSLRLTKILHKNTIC